MPTRLEQPPGNIAVTVLGALTFTAPSLLGYVGPNTASFSAWVMGVVTVLAAAFASSPSQKRRDMFIFSLGILFTFLPWLLNFSSSESAMWANLTLGPAVAMVSGIDLWKQEHPPSLEG